MNAKTAGRVTDRLASILETLVGVIFFAILVMIILLVLLRYVFNTSIKGGYELDGMLFIYTTAIGAAAVIGRRQYIAIDFLIARLKGRLRIAADILVQLIVAGINSALLVLSLEWIRKVGSFLSPVLRLPNRFIQMAIPIGMGLAVLFCLLNIIRDLTGDIRGLTGDTREMGEQDAHTSG